MSCDWLTMKPCPPVTRIFPSARSSRAIVSKRGSFREAARSDLNPGGLSAPRKCGGRDYGSGVMNDLCSACCWSLSESKSEPSLLSGSDFQGLNMALITVQNFGNESAGRLFGSDKAFWNLILMGNLGFNYLCLSTSRIRAQFSADRSQPDTHRSHGISPPKVWRGYKTPPT